MVMSSRSTIVGVFRDPTMAEQALDALTNAGFTNEQIRYAGANGGSGSFLGDLKSLFTGQDASNSTFAQDMADMGLSDEEARYYENEYRNGHRVIAVKALGREQEAMSIMQRFGAYNHVMQSRNAANAASVTPDYAQSAAAPVATNQVVRPQDAYYGQGPANQAERDVRREQLAQEETVKENRENLQARAQAPQMAHAQQPQQPQQAPIAQPSMAQQVQQNQVNATAVNSDTQLQAMQAQLQAVQQQLRDTQAQLEMTKQREAQLQAAKMRDTHMHELQRQLEQAQAQLQAARQELQASQERVNQLDR